MNVGNGVYGKLYDVDGKKVLVLDNHKDFTFTNGTLQKEYDECGSSGRNWQLDAGQINKVVINGNIFPKNVSGWFANCTNLTEIENIQKLKTSNITDMTAMFYQTKLTSMDLTCFDTSKVTNMYLMFGDCTQLEYINFGDIDVSKVTSIALMFSNCTKLKKLDLSCFNNNQFTSLSSLRRCY